MGSPPEPGPGRGPPIRRVSDCAHEPGRRRVPAHPLQLRAHRGAAGARVGAGHGHGALRRVELGEHRRLLAQGRRRRARHRSDRRPVRGHQPARRRGVEGAGGGRRARRRAGLRLRHRRQGDGPRPVALRAAARWRRHGARRAVDAAQAVVLPRQRRRRRDRPPSGQRQGEHRRHPAGHEGHRRRRAERAALAGAQRPSPSNDCTAAAIPARAASSATRPSTPT